MLDLDLNLLRPLWVLLEERHVSNAADRLGISEPAMSRTLQRLRSTLGDELLVRRGGRGYQRSARADALLVAVREILARVDDTILRQGFVPEECDTTFRVATTDYASIVLVPKLLERLAHQAPKAAIYVRPWEERSLEDVASGRLDAVIICTDSVPAALEAEHLFNETYVCVLAANHAISGRRIPLSTYLAQTHAVIDVHYGTQQAIDGLLAVKGARRTASYRTPFFASAILSAARTSMIVTTPRRLADEFICSSDVRVVEAPRELPGFSYSLVWHKSLQLSDAHHWFREQVRTVAKSLSRVDGKQIVPPRPSTASRISKRRSRAKS
jgi:DNA-binding transcriptional LysR family regulator